MNNIQRYLTYISRIVVGLVFIYSGFVKGIDPLGSTYKFGDYFAAFGTNWANVLSFSLAVLLAIAEFIIGVAILLNIKIKQSSFGALLFMAVFTPLTFYLAIANPVHDCGCFGDAWILTNWQTFGKNLVLLIPTLYLFFMRKKITSKLSCVEQWIIAAFFALSISIVMFYSYNHLPILDFRPYKVGAHIPSEMIIPEGAPADSWESTFIYSKNGEEKEFGVDALPDSTWTFVDAVHKLKAKGYEPPIHDFTITSVDGIDITDIVLSSENYNFLLVSYNVDKANYKNSEAINKIANYCYQEGYPFYCLTSSSDESVTHYIEKTGASYEFYNTDEITLKTIVRSNPGLVLVKDGTIIEKWHVNDIPDSDNFTGNLVNQSITKYKKQADNNRIVIMSLLAFFSILSYIYLRKKFFEK